MSERYRIIFARLDDATSIEQASSKLQSTLKLSPEKCEAFFNQQAIFSPSDKAKALKQSKVFANLGIQTRLINVQPSSAEQNKDEQILNALDYITSSLMRLEERLDDIQQQQLSSQNQQFVQLDDEYTPELDLDDELPLSEQKTNSRLPLYWLAGLVTLLLLVLGGALLFPDWFAW